MTRVLSLSLVRTALALAFGAAGMANAWAAAPLDPFSATALAPAPGARLDLGSMVQDASGRAVRLSALTRDRPILFVPVQHRCPNICGVTLAGVADALRDLKDRPGADYAVIAFGIDPREGPAEAGASLASLRDRAPALGPDGVAAVTASAAVVAAATAALGFRYAWDERLGQFAHPAAVAVLAPDGRLVRWLPGLQPQPGDLHEALAEARASRGPTVVERAAVFLCYRYDPASGRFTPSILAGFQALGGLSVLGLAALILGMARRGRPREGRP